MRRFSSEGPINRSLHYYAPREELIAEIYTGLVGKNPSAGGDYTTVWAPRQTGKTWLMQQVMFRLQKDERFDVLIINLEHLKYETDAGAIIAAIAKEIGRGLYKDFSGVNTQVQFQEIFEKKSLDKPLVLMLDELDVLDEKTIAAIIGVFRNIYIHRMDEVNKATEQKTCRLHSVAFIGMHSVLGVGNIKDIPFNVQRNIHIPNLTHDETAAMFKWYEKESGQTVEQAVIDKLFDETAGQPALTSWFGKLLTETYNQDQNRPITMEDFEEAYEEGIHTLPNSILNIISKAKKEPYEQMVLELFKTDRKIEFTYDSPILNFLYLNGVIDREKEMEKYYAKFSSSFVQKRLFNHFSSDLFLNMGKSHEPFESMDNVISVTHLDVQKLAKLYQTYLQENKDWLLADVPRRKNLRVYEAVFYFNVYAYLNRLLRSCDGRVVPEFPTGNGKIDLIVTLAGKTYGIELKSYSTERNYKEALKQAARYAAQLELTEISLVFFVEYIDAESRAKYEKDHLEKESGITVKPVFIETGN